MLHFFHIMLQFLNSPLHVCPLFLLICWPGAIKEKSRCSVRVSERLPNPPVLHKHVTCNFYMFPLLSHLAFCSNAQCGLDLFLFLAFFLISCFSLCIVSTFNSLGYFYCKVMLHQLLIEVFCHFKLPSFNCNLQPFFQIILRTKYKLVSEWFQKK